MASKYDTEAQVVVPVVLALFDIITQVLLAEPIEGVAELWTCEGKRNDDTLHSRKLKVIAQIDRNRQERDLAFDSSRFSR